jgi:polyphosphate kinase
VEVLVPVKQPEIIRTILDRVLPVYLADNVKARQMTSSGSYRPRKIGKEPLNAQEVLLQRRAAMAKKEKHVPPTRMQS